MPRNRFRTSGALLAILLALVAVPAPTQEAPGAESGPPPGMLGLLQEIQGVLMHEHVPGVGIALVAKDRIIWTGGVGKADVAANRDVTSDTFFRVGSISKGFVALALLKLQEEGKIDLNAKLAILAPEIPAQNPWEATHPIRIADLLEHTAGFDDMHPSGTYNVLDPPDIKLIDVLQKFPAPLESRWPPGTRMAYSNPDYGIAGYLVEKTANEPYELYIRENILLPLGMLGSDFRLTNLNRPGLAKGYKGSGGKPVPYVAIYLRPAGDFKSSPAEFAHFIQMMLNRGKLGDAQIVRPESIDRMEYPQTTLAARAGLKDGYGLANYVNLSGVVATHGHDGGIDGFVSTYAYSPAQGLGYAAFLNSSGSVKAVRDIAKLLQDYLLAGQTIPAPPSGRAPADLEKFAGYYARANPRDQQFAFLDALLGGKRVFVENNTLYESGWFAGALQLVPVGDNQFRKVKEPEASTIFFQGENGEAVMADLSFFGIRTSVAWPAARLALILCALVLMASSLLFALVWIPRKLMGRMRGVARLSVRCVPLLAVIALGCAVLLLNNMPGWYAGTYNILTVGFWLLTWIFAALSVYGLFVTAFPFRQPVKAAVRIHSLLVAIACCGIAAYLARWGMIGFHFWGP